ncbi:MAG: putative molybdenum carrier protein [Candidatus Omnitrophica bacterium]|nr:putative molybdenum carrier protein [Candidatus Omnitrophota bacterium]
MQRTEWNVRNSDGTAILTLAGTLTGGSKRTAEFASKLGKPMLHLSKEETANPAEELRQFIAEHGIMVLSVAGPRASKEPGIAEFVKATLTQAFTYNEPS